MKKIFIFLLTSVFAFAACEEITENYEDPAQQLEVTSTNVVFSAEGGSKTVLVTANAEWTYSAGDTWYDVERSDGELVIYVDANTTGTNRYSTITVATAELSETVSVAQTFAVTEGKDLSASETSNCYIANTGTSYRFNALVKGNGKAVDFGGIAAYTDKYGITIDPEDIVYADLLWEATLDGDKTRSRNIMDGSPVYKDGFVYFTTGEAEGNAVIAVNDAQGTVLWSWHIWVTDQEIGETEGNGYIWQDRNLGANSNESGDITNRGLLYQWGRKDPFLPSAAVYGSEDIDVFNEQVGNGSGVWNYSTYTTKFATEAPGNIPFSIKNPMTVLLNNGSVYSWYLTSTVSDLYNSCLWGDSLDLNTYVKSIFDPCPPGYNVPVDSPWVSGKDQNVNYWSVDDEYGRYWIGGDNAYYPCVGALSGSAGSLMYTGSRGYYWSSGVSSATSYLAKYLYFSPTTSISYSSNYPVHAMAVRCMRVK